MKEIPFPAYNVTEPTKLGVVHPMYIFHLEIENPQGNEKAMEMCKTCPVMRQPPFHVDSNTTYAICSSVINGGAKVTLIGPTEQLADSVCHVDRKILGNNLIG